MIVLLALAGCQGWTPTVQHVDTRIAAVDFTEARAEVVFLVDNPWPVGLTVAGYTYAVRVADASILAGAGSAPVVVPRRGQTEVVVPVGLHWAALREAAGAVDGEVPWALEAELVVTTPFGDRALPVGVSGSVPLLRVPEVSVHDLRFGWTDSAAWAVAVDLRVAGQGGYGVRSARCALELDGRPVIAGAALTRPDGDDTIVSLITELSLSSGMVAAGRLWTGAPVLASIALDATLQTPLGDVPLGTRLEHTLVWR